MSETLTSSAAETSLDGFRVEVKAFLAAHCPESMRQPIASESDTYFGGRNGTFKNTDQEHWFKAMAERGWTTPEWPKKYGGGGLSKAEAKILKQEMRSLGCSPPLVSFGIWMLGPALLQFGTEEQREKYLPDIIQGKIRWCQGYSEPGAGSDLANLQTLALSSGDDYIVNGQKVWTSYADKADMIFALVRTDGSGKKQIGITFLLIDMETEGVSTRPIKLISGKSPFCETFFDNVRVPKANVVGQENAGWTVAKYLLTHERSAISGAVDGDMMTPLSFYAKKSVGLTDGKLSDGLLRAQVAAWEIDGAGFKFTLDRINEEMKAGQAIGARSSFMKYYGSELNKRKYELRLDCQGRDALAWEGEEYHDGKIARQFCRTKGNSIEGGTSEIQLNIISKHILGLPS